MFLSPSYQHPLGIIDAKKNHSLALDYFQRAYKKPDILILHSLCNVVLDQREYISRGLYNHNMICQWYMRDEDHR